MLSHIVSSMNGTSTSFGQCHLPQWIPDVTDGPCRFSSSDWLMTSPQKRWSLSRTLPSWWGQEVYQVVIDGFQGARIVQNVTFYEGSVPSLLGVILCRCIDLGALWQSLGWGLFIRKSKRRRTFSILKRKRSFRERVNKGDECTKNPADIFLCVGLCCEL